MVFFEVVFREEHISSSSIVLCWALTVLVVTQTTLQNSILCSDNHLHCFLSPSYFHLCSFLKNRLNNVLLTSQIVKILFLQKFHQILKYISVTYPNVTFMSILLSSLQNSSINSRAKWSFFSKTLCFLLCFYDETKLFQVTSGK